jgi:hypothetical protein
MKKKTQLSNCQYSIEYYDTETGLVKSTDNYFCSGGFAQWREIYDSDGLLLKREGYDKDDKLYSVQEYQDELEVKDEGWRKNEHHVKTLIYDDNRQLQSAVFFVNDRFVCRFEYERHPTGAIKRTVAYDTEGIILAEYPDRRVLHIDPNGEAYDKRQSNIFKHTNFY